jgi:hypothetical protein
MIMRQLSQAVPDDDVLPPEELVTVERQQHPEWDWPFLATCCRSSAARSWNTTLPHQQ